ncbi:unnamed protein product, partial [marine sediment metagenome]
IYPLYTLVIARSVSDVAIPNKIQIGYIIEFTQNEIAQFIPSEREGPGSQ